MKKNIEGKKVKISVVMPVYNAAEYLPSSVGDILSQTYHDFELICVDDGSKDESLGILDAFAEKDDRVKVIHQQNKGGGSARNTGLDSSVGEYMLFLDSDDRFENDLIEKVLNKAEGSNSDLVVYGGDVFEHHTGDHKAAPWLLSGSELVSLENPFSNINTSVWNKLYKREFLLRHNIRFQENRIVDTMCFVFLAVAYANKIETVPETLVHYRTNNDKSVISRSDMYPLEAYDALLLVKGSLEKDMRFEERQNIFIGFVGKYISERLHILKTGKGFEKLYSKLHEDGLRELGITKNSLQKFPREDEYTRILYDMLQKDATEYLFDREKKIQKIGIIRKEIFIFPLPESSEKMSIVIYGGGNVGKDYFLQAMHRSDIHLKAWIDRDYERIGFPLQSPEVLKEVEFDIIVIGITGKQTADVIRNSLVEKGVSEEKIIWRKPIEV